MHTCITSCRTCAAALRADRSPVDALRALFPGGTITGCPKVRCMQIIAALEGEGRGAYTGSLGWLGTDGDADFNILIRTLTMRGARIELRAGARHRRGFDSRARARRNPRQGARPAARVWSTGATMSAALGSWVDGVPRRRAAGRRSRAALRRRSVRDHARARGTRALPRGAPGAPGAGLRAPRHSASRRCRRLRAEIAAAVALAPPLAMLKIIVTRGSARAPRLRAAGRRDAAARGVAVAATPACRRDRRWAWRCAWRDHGSAENPALAGIKHLNRLENVLAAARSRRGTAPSKRCCSMRRDTWSAAR